MMIEKSGSIELRDISIAEELTPEMKEMAAGMVRVKHLYRSALKIAVTQMEILDEEFASLYDHPDGVLPRHPGGRLHQGAQGDRLSQPAPDRGGAHRHLRGDAEAAGGDPAAHHRHGHVGQPGARAAV